MTGPGSSTFMVIDFFDYESQTTSLISGMPRIIFHFFCCSISFSKFILCFYLLRFFITFSSPACPSLTLLFILFTICYYFITSFIVSFSLHIVTLTRTYDFCAVHTTGTKPVWEFATTFKIIVDDFLLRYLATDVITLELNMVIKMLII